MSSPLNLLVIEDSEADFLLVERNLKQHGLQANLHRVSDYTALNAALASDGWDAVLSDYCLPGMEFRNTLGLIREKAPDLPIILVSGSIGEEEAMDLLHRGLSDFVLKDRPTRLAGALRHSLETAKVTKAQRVAEAALFESEARFSTMFRSSPLGIGVSRISDARLVEVNDALLEIIKAQREDLIGRTTVEAGFFLHPEDRERMVQRLKEDGRVRNFQFQFRRKDGELLDLLMSGELIHLGGEAYLLGMMSDITPLKRAERSLQASEERYRSLFENLVEGFAHCRLIFEGGEPVDWEYLAVNPAFERLTGLKDVAGRRISDVVPSLRKDNPELFSIYGEVVRTGEPAKVESFLPALGVWLAISVYRPAEGEFVAVFDNITDRKESEAALRMSEGRYRSLFENLSEGFAHCRLILEDGIPVDWEYLAVNPAYASVTGQRDVVGRRLSEVIPQFREHNAEAFRILGEVGRTGVPAKFETYVSDLGIWLSNSAYRPAPGEFIAVLDNITTRKRSEEALRASEQRFQAVFDASPVGIMLSRMATGEIIEANAAFLALFGFELQQVLGSTTIKLGIWEDPRGREAAMAEIRSTGRIHAMDADLRTSVGARVSVTWSTEVIDLGGERVLLNVVQDVTERNRANAERERLHAEVAHAQKLESLGALAGGVSHDMNNVLGAIMALGSMLKETHQDDPGISKAMDNLMHAARRGRDLVKGLTDFARKDIPEPKPMDLNEVVRMEASLLRRTTLQKVAVDLNLSPLLPDVVGDASSISNALMNLCVNALDAMPQGGRITLTTRLGTDAQVELSVKDTGEGMPPEVLQRAMEPFFTTKPIGKGTGLGLALVYGVMKAHGGRVDIHSGVGEGTEIVLSFPKHVVAAGVTDEVPDSDSVPSRKLQILLVDDDDLIRVTVPSILEILGHDVVPLAGGLEALKRLQSGLEPDLVILDLSMPGMDGEETLMKLRLLKPDLPVLLSTGYQDERQERILERFSKVGVISKPFTLADLKMRLAQMS